MLFWILFLVLIIATVGTGGMGLRVWRRRRCLDALGRRHKMHRSSGKDVEEVLRSLAGEWAQAGLRDVLEGRDGSGRFFAARKGWGREMREIFIAELNQHTPARGLSLESLAQSSKESLRMQWDLSPEQALDAQAREVVQRVLREFAAFKMHHPKPQISLQVGERGAVLYAPMTGEEARTSFIAAARVLRGDLMHCLYRRENIGPGASPVVGERSGAVSGTPSPNPAASSVKEEHPDIERALENLEAEPLVSTQELVAEKLAPPRKGWQRVKGKDVFEIPEPEEKVVVIEACASRTKAAPVEKDLSEEERRALFFLP